MNDKTVKQSMDELSEQLSTLLEPQEPTSQDISRILINDYCVVRLKAQTRNNGVYCIWHVNDTHSYKGIFGADDYPEYIFVVTMERHEMKYILAAHKMQETVTIDVQEF